MGKQWKQRQTLFWGAPKSLQMATAAIKFDSVGEGEGGMIWENGIETCIISYTPNFF